MMIMDARSLVVSETTREKFSRAQRNERGTLDDASRAVPLTENRTLTSKEPSVMAKKPAKKKSAKKSSAKKKKK